MANKLPTPFGALLAASGLSFPEAGAWLEVASETVRDWARGKSLRIPPRVTIALADLVADMALRADTLASQIDTLIASHGLPLTIEIAVSTDDHEASLNGLPCQAVERAVIGMALAQLDQETIARISLVPRGSTIAVAAAELARCP